MTKRSVGSNSGNTNQGGYAERTAPRQREGARNGARDASRVRGIKKLTSSGDPEKAADPCEVGLRISSVRTSLRRFSPVPIV